MATGYSIFDPLVVLISFVLTLYLLIKDPQRLLLYIPLMLSLFFFVPFVTLLTNWHTVPMLIAGWWVFQKKTRFPASISLPIAVIFVSFAAQFLVSVVYGDVGTRLILRASHYVGVFALFLFAYYMSRRPGGYLLLLQGFALAAAVHSIYSFYQIIAFDLGLPFRGLVRDQSGTASAAVESGLFLRVNGLSSEPKRLAYVLFVGALACFELVRIDVEKRRTLYRAFGYLSLIASILTFSGSYYLALVLFGITMALVNMSVLKSFAVLSFACLLVATFLGSATERYLDAMQQGIDRRFQEVEIGLDGEVVYRQEFFAQDYVANHPSVVATGLGIGRYNVALFREYGLGVGYGQNGRILPLNSNFFELIFDLGGLATISFYACILVLTIRAKKAGERFLFMALVMLAYQSLTIQVLHFLVLVMGAAMARLKTPAIVDKVKRPAQGMPTVLKHEV
ncbi:hypothetical protein [Pseudoruegeria sp. HB172150]|uniref:hypothetical protein n=1 Tax=Pseudoruegeria sp. HB172150 TaxID=2721164 RepID=UPI001556C94E|nr:hypothetical protein [Pseudoruegeria sp. HB172150]